MGVWVVGREVQTPGVVGDEGRFQELEGAEVDRGVGEHADETHGEAAVGRAQPAFAEHLLRGGDDERVASEPVGFDVALHAELQCVEGIDTESEERSVSDW